MDRLYLAKGLRSCAWSSAIISVPLSIPLEFQCIRTRALGKKTNNHSVSLINYFVQYSFTTLAIPIIHLYCPRKFAMLLVSPGYHSHDTGNLFKNLMFFIYDNKIKIYVKFFLGGGGQNRFILCNAKLTNTGQPAHVHNYKLGDTMPESDAFYCVSFFSKYQMQFQ